MPVAASPAVALPAVEIVFADLEKTALLLDAAEQAAPRLSEADHARIAHRGGDTSWRTARIALRIVLERWAGAGIRQQPFVIERGGRPRLVAGVPAFSHSHTDGAALIAVSRYDPIGVDIEAQRDLKLAPDRREKILKAGAALNSAAMLNGSDTERCLQAWVRLEAIAKANGSGIGATLAEAGVFGRGKSERVRATASPDKTVLRVQDLSLGPKYFGALALPEGDPAPDVLVFPETQAGLDAFLRARRALAG